MGFTEGANPIAVMSTNPDEIPESGAVFTFGKSRFADNEPSHFFIKNDPVVAISCGDEHSAVICQQGRVFVFGGNAWGQLGLGHTDEVARPSCVKWLKPHRALLVACGRAHTVFVTDTHAIYTVGHNADGQLGTGGTENQSVPQYVELECENSRIKQVSAGSSHTAILTEGGQVFMCGSNTEGQLGLGEDVKASTTFTELNFMEAVAFVECGYYHTIFITNQGVVFVTGENEGQRLGTRNLSPNIYVPEVLPIDTPIKSACCGASHTFLLSMDEAKILAFGSNEKGQLGLPKSVVDVTEPTEIFMEKMFDGYQLKLVACGAMHTAFVTDNGLLYTCGESRNNKLCIDEVDNVDNSDEPDQYTPKRVSAMNGFIVDNVACGGCHTILTATASSYGTTEVTAVDEEPKHISLTELPPLQKIPASIMNRTDDENPTAGIRIPLSEDNNGNPVNCEDTTSMDSLEANVSGSHIVNINDLENGNGSIHDVPDIDTDDNATGTEENITIIENVADTIASVEETIIKEIVKTPGENCDEKKSLGVPDKQIETHNSPPPRSPVLQNLLQLPEGLQTSPDVSRKSEGSQKSETYSKSENETIICGSDNDKSSPVAEKQAKTQAVMPIVRSEDLITSGEQQRSDDAEITGDKLTEKGRFGKMFQAIREKENSCMGKGKVIENVVTENVNKGLSKAEDSVHKVEETIETEIRNQTNSRACIIF